MSNLAYKIVPVDPVSPREILAVSQIPSIPAILQRILEALNNPAVTSMQLEKLVVQDPGLSMRLLKTVNSSFYALPQRVQSINQAIVLLGISALKTVASGLVLLETFGKMSRLEQSFLTRVWNHSLVTARLMPYFSKAETPQRRDELAMVAMLHDVGHLVLDRHFEHQYRKVVEKSVFPSVESEVSALGIDHATIGAELLKEWAFPASIVELVRNHHNHSAAGKKIDPLRTCDFIAESLLVRKDFLLLDEKDLPEFVLDNFKAVNWNWDRFRELAESWNLTSTVGSMNQMI